MYIYTRIYSCIYIMSTCLLDEDHNLGIQVEIFLGVHELLKVRHGVCQAHLPSRKHTSKETYKRDLQKRPTKEIELLKVRHGVCQAHLPSRKHMSKARTTDLFQLPTKETYKRDLQKRSAKETNKRDLRKRLTKETYQRDLRKRPEKEIYKRDLLKRPTKEA